MKKLVTDNPETMVENMVNYAFAKDNQVYVREVEGDITLVEYVRKLEKELFNHEYKDEDCTAEEFGEYMDDDRITCILYWSLVGYAELRARLKKYEDALGEIDPKEIREVIARNCVAWDTSKDKEQGLLPEVTLSNKYLYKLMHGKEYRKFEAMEQYNIE